MKPKEMRDMSLDEMKAKQGELLKETFNLRMQNAAGQLENPIRLRMVRKDIARMETIIAERERAS